MVQESKNGGDRKHSEKPSENKLIPFLSYSKINKMAAREFAERLKSEGWIDSWFDEEDILPGQVWEDIVANNVRNSHAVIILLSKNAVASEGFFQKEIRLALDTVAEKPDGTIFILPIRLNGCEVPEMLKKYQYVDYFGGVEQKERVYSSLIASLKLRAKNLGIMV